MFTKIPEWLDGLLLKVDECSFGIYLIHMVVIKCILLNYNPYESAGWISFAGIFILVFAISYFMIRGLKKIPIINIIL